MNDIEFLKEYNIQLLEILKQMVGCGSGSDDPEKSAVSPEKPKKKSRVNDIGLKLIDGGKKPGDRPTFANQTPPEAV